ncbi:hypothetical protein GCM10008940_29770 [Microbulbifer agarilyticus]
MSPGLKSQWGGLWDSINNCSEVLGTVTRINVNSSFGAAELNFYCGSLPTYPWGCWVIEVPSAGIADVLVVGCNGGGLGDSAHGAKSEGCH